PRSICAPEDPAAPKASRQNCSRADAVFELLRINSSAKSRSSGLLLSSSTSSALTMAPTGLIRSWQTFEHSSAASSRESGAGPDDDVPDIGFSQSHSPAAWWCVANADESRLSLAFDTLRRSTPPPLRGFANGPESRRRRIIVGASVPIAANAPSPWAGNARDRRQKRRDEPPGRTDRAAGQRPRRNWGCRQRSPRAPHQLGHSRRTGGHRLPDEPER